MKIDVQAFKEEQSALSELVLQLCDQVEKAEANYHEANAKFEAARKAKERADETFGEVSLKWEKLLAFTVQQGYSAEVVREFCRSERQTQNGHKSIMRPGMRRLSNGELMFSVALLLERIGRPLTLEDILEWLAEENVFLPGSAPEKNLTAYLSRSPLIRSFKRGWYTYDPDLLDAAKRQYGGANE